MVWQQLNETKRRVELLEQTVRAQADMLANAPDRSGEFFRVPRIIEESVEE